MFRVWDKMATSQAEPQDPSRWRVEETAEQRPFTAWTKNFFSEKRKIQKVEEQR
jgi:hypothetical protein